MNPTDVNSIPIPRETAMPDTPHGEHYRRDWLEWEAVAVLHPVPTDDDTRADRQWLFDRLDDGSLDPNGEYCGLYVAVYRQRVVGSGLDPFAMQIRLARELNVHPARIVTAMRGGGDEEYQLWRHCCFSMIGCEFF